MKLTEKVIGICGAYDSTSAEYPMMREAGFNAIRMWLPFPWTDCVNGTLSERYVNQRAEILRAKQAGFSVMCTTPGLGSYRFDHEAGVTRWHDEWPDFCGEKGSGLFYRNVEETCAFYARDLQGAAGPLWCNMNEIDIPTFHGAYSIEIAADTAYHSAKGIVAVDSDALCGINLSNLDDNALHVADMAYREGHAFGYIGDDQYFGSWQEGEIDRWNDVIERLHARYHLPVLADEWGYSSGGKHTEKPGPEVEIPVEINSVCLTFGWHYQAEGGHTEEAQAAYIRRGLEIFQNNPHVLGSFLFCWKDAVHCYHCGKQLCPAECFWGIVDTKMNKKPAWYTVKEFTEGKR